MFITISNDSNRQIVVIIEYRKTETTVNTKGVLGASYDFVEAHYEKEKESKVIIFYHRTGILNNRKFVELFTEIVNMCM